MFEEWRCNLIWDVFDYYLCCWFYLRNMFYIGECVMWLCIFFFIKCSENEMLNIIRTNFLVDNIKYMFWFL